MAAGAMKAVLLVAALGLVAAGLAIGGAAGERQELPKWEYRSVELSADSIERDMKALNALGADGWELVTVAQNGTLNCYFVLKRRR